MNKNLPAKPGITAHGFSFKPQNPVLIPLGLIILALTFLFIMMIAALGLVGAGFSLLLGRTDKKTGGAFGAPNSGGTARFPGQAAFTFMTGREKRFADFADNDAIDVEAVEIIDERDEKTR